MESYKACYQAIYVRFGSGKSPGYSGNQQKDKQQDICPSSDSEYASVMQLIEHYEKFIRNRRDAKKLLKLHDNIIRYYLNLIGDAKVKILRKYT